MRVFKVGEIDWKIRSDDVERDSFISNSFVEYVKHFFDENRSLYGKYRVINRFQEKLGEVDFTKKKMKWFY